MPESHNVHVAPERLARWLDGFAHRHPDPLVTVEADSVLLTSPDGAEARIELGWGGLASADPLAELVAQVNRPRRIGAVLIRRSAHAVGIFAGPELVSHSIGRHYVQGRSKAGGWSQQRYARRRENQADKAFAKATRAAESLLVGEAGRLDALILGGDGRAVATVLSSPALGPLRAVLDRHPHGVLPVPDPNLRVLRDALPSYLAVSIHLNDAARPRSPLAQDDDQPGGD